MKEIHISKAYSTPNTALAAYLYSQGYEYLGTDPTDKSNVAFKFSNSSRTMAKAISDWQIGRAEGNCNQFYFAYRKLLREAKNG